jgi:hypothetical protein
VISWEGWKSLPFFLRLLPGAGLGLGTPPGRRLPPGCPSRAKLGLFCAFHVQAEPTAPRWPLSKCPRPSKFGFVLRILPSTRPRPGQIGFVLRLWPPASRRPCPNWVCFAHFASSVRPEVASSNPQSAIGELGLFCAYCDKRHNNNGSQPSRSALGPEALLSRFDPRPGGPHLAARPGRAPAAEGTSIYRRRTTPVCFINIDIQPGKVRAANSLEGRQQAGTRGDS